MYINKRSIQQIVLEKLNAHIEKKKSISTLPQIIHKNSLKMYHRPKSKG